MSQVKVVWNESAFMRDLMTATKGALDAGAVIGVAATQMNLSRAGTPTSKTAWTAFHKASLYLQHYGGLGKIIRDPKIFAAFQKARLTKSGNTSTMGKGIDRAIDIKVRGGGTLVDPPGGMPRNRTGALMNSIAFDTKSPTSRRIGVTGEGTVKNYARIQEFGGTVRSVGGQPFFKTWDGQIVYVSRNSPHASRLPKTKPAPGGVIRIPARPYLRRSVNEAKDEMAKAMQGAFSAILREKGWTA